MARLPQYNKRNFSPLSQILAYDPSGQVTSLIPGQSLLDYIGLPEFNEALLNRVQWFSTNDVAKIEDLPLGRIIYTGGNTAIADGGGGHYVVVETGGSVVLDNGFELLLLPLGDLTGSDATNADVTTSTGSQTVAGALDDRVVRVGSVADLVARAATLEVGGVYGTVGYYGGWNATATGIPKGGNYYELVDAGSAGARPAEDGGAIIYCSGGSGGLYLKGLFPDGVNVLQFGAKGDSLNNDTSSIQACVNFSPEVFFPYTGGRYLISEPIDIGIGQVTPHIYGSGAWRGTAEISTTPNFNGFSMFRNWSDSMYSGPGESRDGPPADMTAYSSSISRYPTIESLYISIRGAQTNRITPIDLVAMQESSLLSKLIISGDQGIQKGFPIRAQDAIGAEMSFNAFSIDNIVVYGDQWKGMIFAKGAGSDLNIQDFITTLQECDESPFQIEVIDATFRNLHCETTCAGQPTFDISGTDMRITDSFVFIDDGQGDVFSFTNPNGTGFQRCGLNANGLRVYPVGGNWANVTNKNSINLMNDTSQAEAKVVPLEFPQGSKYPVMVQSLNRHEYSATDENGIDYVTTLENDFALSKSAQIGGSFTSADPLVIPYILDDGNSGAFAVVTGRNVSTGQPFMVNIAILQADNSAGFTPDHVEILNQTSTVPGTLSVSVVSNRCELATTDASGGQNIRISLFGNLQRDKVIYG